MAARSFAGRDDERGSWTAVVRPPHPALEPVLARPYVGFAQAGAGGSDRLEAPTPTVTLILNLGEPFGGLPRCFVAGLSDRPVAMQDSGELTCLDVKLTPLGAYRLLGLPVDSIAGAELDLEDVWGVGVVRGLIDRLCELTPDARFELLDSFLLRRLVDGPAPSPAVEWAWRRLSATHGLTPIGELRAELGCSHRYLSSEFRRQVGLPPKRVARILRFNRALRELRTSRALRWAELASACGYYDQAHLNRDFRDLAGTTPTEFLRRQVNSFQDRLARET